MNPYDMVRAQLEKTVPFATYTGVKIEEVAEGRGVASLTQRDEISNHINSVHAGAMFTLGEAASGAALAGTLVDRLMGVRPVAAKAEITYVAVAKGSLKATAAPTETAAAIKEKLDTDGKVQFDVDVTVTDADDKTVGTMVVRWHVKNLG